MVTKPIRVAVWQHLVQQVQCVSVLFLNTGRKLAVIAERNMAPEICHKHSRHCQGCETTFQTIYFLADGGWMYFCILLTEI